MNDDAKTLPDLSAGIPLADVSDGQLLQARIGENEVLLWRQDDEVRAFEAHCTHLGAPLADGLVVGDTLRCPWHHACFSLSTGEALAAPAFTPLRQWRTEKRHGRLTAGAPVPAMTPRAQTRGSAEPRAVVIVGGGAGGFSAADRLRRRGFAGAVTCLSDDTDEPYDRTLLTKDYLAGTCGEDGLRISPDSLADLGVELRTDTRVLRIDRASKRVILADGAALPYDRLLLAPGAEPKRLDISGADLPHVHLLRSAADARRIVAAVAKARRVVVIGGSFIGTEAAASLRDRKLEVHLVSPDAHPLASVLGRAVSDLIVETHRAHGVRLHLGRSVVALAQHSVRLDDGTALPADFVVVGIGVTPRTSLADQAGLAVDDGILVDDRLRSSDPDIFAVGDAARWPDPRGGKPLRVEHWAVAERQGQVAAANMLGDDRRFDVVPFFWTKQFDLSLRHVGHAETPDDLVIDGRIEARDATLRYAAAGRIAAVATIGRDRASLEAERRMQAEFSGAAPGAEGAHGNKCFDP